MKSLALILNVLFLAGCTSSHSNRTVQAASPAQTEALLGKVKSLEGKWASNDDKGQSRLATVFEVSSNGNVVREIMFPGHPHEMTNLYHMDGPSLVMTHYCAVGNQPRMRATGVRDGKLAFAYDSVTNHTSPDQTVMREMTIEFKDNDHIVERWQSYVGDKPVEGAVFELTRMK